MLHNSRNSAAPYIARSIEPHCLKASSQFPVLILNGARQVGKTTLLRHLSEGSRTYVTLDDPLVLALAREDPALFMQRFPPPVLIDEIQYAPQLLPYIKMAVDAQPTPGQFWLTGSQQFHLMRGVSESLAGRVAVLQLLGISRREALGMGLDSTPFLPDPETLQVRARSSDRLGLLDLYSAIWRGAYPALLASPEMDRDLFYSSYVQTYLQRDVRDLGRVGDEMAFLRFLRAAAARTGQLLNLAELARDADISPNTAKAWLSILQASGVVHLLEPYFTNVTKRLVKAPKLYFLDTGLCAYLTEWSRPETLEAGAMSGAILETWVFAEILKSWMHAARRPAFHYFRDRDRQEIDLLILQDGRVYPLEIKKTASPDKQAIRNFALLEKSGIPLGPGGVLCLADTLLPLSSTATAIPVALL